MPTLSNNVRHKQLYLLLNRFGFLRMTIDPESLTPFKQILQLLFNKIAAYSFRKNLSEMASNVAFLIQILNGNDKQVNLNSTVKKLAIIHNLIHKFSIKQIWFKQLADLLQNEIYMILKQDIVSMLNPKEKRVSSSFTQVYNYLKRLSKSKNFEKEQNKLDIQTQTDKSTIREMITKILEPLCLYILKVIKDQQLYSDIIQNNQHKLSNQIVWKIINWSRGLGEIILYLIRLSRYLKKDLLGIIVFLVYVISIDLSVYYHRLRIHIYQQSLFWQAKIEEVLIKNISMKVNYSYLNQQLIGNASLIELKDLIQQVKQIEEKLQFLYFNKLWKNSKNQFAKSFQILGRKDIRYEQCLDVIQNFVEQSKSIKNKFNLYRDIKREEIKIKSSGETLKALTIKQTKESTNIEKRNSKQYACLSNVDSIVGLQLHAKYIVPSRKINTAYSKKNQLEKVQDSFACKNQNIFL